MMAAFAIALRAMSARVPSWAWRAAAVAITALVAVQCQRDIGAKREAARIEIDAYRAQQDLRAKANREAEETEREIRNLSDDDLDRRLHDLGL